MHDEAFNVGASAENYTIREVAEIVAQVVPGARATFAESSGPDKRSYRVDCSKLARVLPRRAAAVDRRERGRGARTRLRGARDEPRGLQRARAICGSSACSELQEAGRLDEELRWLAPVTVG